jgi:hypothetical protein
VSDTTAELARLFQRFSERECLPASPLYVSWLRALIWPEQTDRAECLRHALDLAQETPPPVTLIPFSGGVCAGETLGRCDPHGAWPEWTAGNGW